MLLINLIRIYAQVESMFAGLIAIKFSFLFPFYLLLSLYVFEYSFLVLESVSKSQMTFSTQIYNTHYWWFVYDFFFCPFVMIIHHVAGRTVRNDMDDWLYDFFFFYEHSDHEYINTCWLVSNNILFISVLFTGSPCVSDFANKSTASQIYFELQIHFEYYNTVWILSEFS